MTPGGGHRSAGGGGAGDDEPARGTLFVVSAPSGAGKTSLVRALVAAEPDIEVSVSHTTRPPRPGEEDGVHYHFVDEPTFLRLVGDGAFLEHARVFEHRYGTSREEVEQHLRAGSDVILEIDWQGGRQIRAGVADIVGVFILPPSLEVLAERLRRRGQDQPEVIERRLREAAREIAHHDEYDYLVVNENFDAALAALRCIVRGRRLRAAAQRVRLRGLIDALLA